MNLYTYRSKSVPSRREYRLTITSELSNLAVVADLVTTAARESGVDEQALYHVQMAADEAVTNVIKHAYRGKKGKEIDLRCWRQGNEFVIEIRDRGQSFEADKVPKPKVHGPLATRPVGGLGIFFMRKLMDTVEYSSNDQGNLLRMTKRIK